MTDREKLKLIDNVIADFWEFLDENDQRNGSMVLISAIASIVEFKGGESINEN